MWNCDLFCRVVDNFGDIGICWRLARQLNREYRVPLRLWVDDLQTFSRLCPAVDPQADLQTIDSIVIRRWPDPFPSVPAADVVIEAFACELPEGYVAEMAARPTAPVWVNLEYLSAERWVDDCHLLPSPNPRSSLVKHFFFPGFTSRTGGLLREHDLLDRLAAFDLAAQREFWSRLGIADPPPAALRVSLFCYENPALPKLLDLWRAGPQPVCLLATCGRATEQVERWLGCQMPPGTMLQTLSLTVHALPFLPQDQYDLLLRACDVNFVRGEDSFVRAQWAQRPFI